jgi:hypothetical protein
MLAKRVLHTKKLVPMVPVAITATLEIPKAKRVLTSKKLPIAPSVEVKPKRILVSAKPVPPPPSPGTYITKAMESFEALREYYAQLGQPIPQSVIKWYHEELALEKKEFDEFWARCAATKACIEGTLRGDDDWTIDLAVNAARQAEKKLPILESDIGEMPAYGTGEFWAWCAKRKKLKSQKEEAMIAAGIPVPAAKPKKPRKKAGSPENQKV